MSVVNLRRYSLKNGLKKKSEFADIPPVVPTPFVDISGGEVFTSGSYKIIRVTGSTNLTVTQGGTVEILVVAGGAGGGTGTAGGGGAGGLIYSASLTLPITASLPVTITRGKDIFLWDTCGKKYVDLLAGYSAVNQGHCHPRILARFIEQASQLTLASRVVHTAKLHEWSNYITHLFQYKFR